MSKKYTRKQIVEAINYWKTKLNETTEEDDFFKARMDNEDLLDEIAAQIRSGEKLDRGDVSRRLAASAARMAAAAANAAGAATTGPRSNRDQAISATRDAIIATRRAVRADNAGDPVNRFMRGF